MKKWLLLILCLFSFSACAVAFAIQDTPADVRLSQTASGRGSEYVIEISDGWKFGGRDEKASASDYPDDSWSTVNLPHTWNVEDGADGDGKYDRGAYWYRKTVDIGPDLAGKRIFLEFLGANQKTDVYVNGKHIKLCGSDEYTHKGGYTAFRYDITDALRTGGNKIAIKVDNSYSEGIAPITADFNMYGGIYRRLYLIAVDPVHVDLGNSGSSGLFLTTPNVRSLEKPADFGTLNIRADIVNEGGTRKEITVTAHIEGDNAPPDIERTYTIAPGDKVCFDASAFVRDPHLWNGIEYSEKKGNADIGYRYRVTVTVSEGWRILDAVSEMVGFRYFYIDKDNGFYLNGEPHPLRGVNRHQFKSGKGSALTEADHDTDIRLIMELGANTVRLSHYPQTDYFYDLCDENGIIVWSEIPLVNLIGKKEEFLDVTKNQLTEMIRQQYNRPSIVVWGLENEVSDKARSEFYSSKQVMAALDGLAHREDASGRYTAQAIDVDTVMDGNDPAALEDEEKDYGWKSDLIAWNIYPGWYSRFRGTFETLMDDKSAQDSRSMGISEYGWGASVEQHALYPVLGRNDLLPTGKWHPEEYQNQMHEEALAYISGHPHLWATYIWCMFDFDVDTRNEGFRAGQNDKGLITDDRAVKKDSFYLYKANWNQREPFVHITSSRYTDRREASTYVKVYSNCDSVVLYQNDAPLGSMTPLGNGVFLWEDVSLELGENRIHAVGTKGGDTCADTCVWTRPAFSATTLVSDTLLVDPETRIIVLPKALSIQEVKDLVYGLNNAAYTIMLENKEITDEKTLVPAGAKALVRSENGSETAEYSFAYTNLLWGKDIQATSTEEGNDPGHAADGDPDTRWTASSNAYPQSITVDLGDAYFLGTLTTSWHDKHSRYYAYTVETSLDGVSFTAAAERLDNTISGTTSDELRMALGRYVRINVHSCSDQAGYAGIYELSIDGWSLSTQAYELDYENKLIFVPNPEELTPEDVLSHFERDGYIRVGIRPSETEDSAEGAQIAVTDFQDREYVFTITAPENAHRYSTDLALYKNVYFSSEEGVSSSGANTHAYNVNDGLASTAWVADINSWGSALYPEWIGVDLGQECTISGIELRFETKGNRVYQYQVLTSADSPLFSAQYLPLDYEVIVDQEGNAEFSDGHYSFEFEPRKARYVAVLVKGNSQYPENKYAAAGIYDFKVFGTAYSDD